MSDSPWTDEHREAALYRLSDCDMVETFDKGIRQCDEHGNVLWHCIEHDSEPTERDDHCPTAVERADQLLAALAPHVAALAAEAERRGAAQALREFADGIDTDLSGGVQKPLGDGLVVAAADARNRAGDGCTARHPVTGMPCLVDGEHDTHQAMGTLRMQAFGDHLSIAMTAAVAKNRAEIERGA